MRVKVYNNRFRVFNSRAKYNYYTESKDYVNVIQSEVALTNAQRLYAHFMIGIDINELLWSLRKAYYLMLGGTASTHKWNVKDLRDLDAAFRLDYYSTVTHSASGMNANGVDSFIKTFLNPSTHLGASTLHVSFYTNEVKYDTLDCISAYKTNEPSIRFIIRSSSFTTVASGFVTDENKERLNSPAILSKGFFSLNTNPLVAGLNARSVAGTYAKEYSASTKPVNNFIIGAAYDPDRPLNYFSNRKFQCISIGSGFTGAQLLLDSFKTTFGQKILNRA